MEHAVAVGVALEAAVVLDGHATELESSSRNQPMRVEAASHAVALHL
jgi:hypothetical protein